MEHPFNSESCGERLYKEIQKHGKLVIGYDFDNTIFDLYNTNGDFSEIINLLKKCSDLGHIMCLYTLESDPERLRWKIDYTRSLGIKVDYINESPLLKTDNSNKPFFNCLLDDRAGLQSAYESLLYAVNKATAYNFGVKKTTDDLIQWIRDWFDKNGKDCNAVVGLSGGKDSTIIATLCAKALGPNRVIGVPMPDKRQGLNDADKIAKYLGIKLKIVNIGETVEVIKTSLGYGVLSGYSLSEQAEQNIPPRVRMTALYAIAQTENGRVACCDNASEAYLGYSTLFGDNVGSFAPLLNLTVTEILKIGDFLGLPYEWVHKKPSDGLPHSSDDEDKFGFTYETLDKYISEGICDNITIKEKIDEMHKKSQFKRDIVKIPSYPNNEKF